MQLYIFRERHEGPFLEIQAEMLWGHRPDLLPYDFYVFGPMKNDLAKERYHLDDEVKDATPD